MSKRPQFQTKNGEFPSVQKSSNTSTPETATTDGMTNSMTSLYSVSDPAGLSKFPSKSARYIALTLVCCMLNVIFLEFIIKIDSSAGTLVTFSQFLFVSVTGAITWWQFGKNKNQVPMKYHILTVILFWSVNFCNNLAFKYNIPMTLHTIFRSGSLVTNMLLGVILAKKKYKLSKYVSVFFISVGIFICTWMSAKSKEAEQGDQGQDSNSESDAITFGILLLVYALIVSSLMGLMQEVTYKKYGKHPNEALFIDHVLGLPCFYLFTDSITSSFGKLLATETVAEFSSSNAYFQSRVETMTAYLPLFKPLYENFLNPLPIGVLFLLINILTSYCCIKSVFVLTTECTSLTVTLVITVRKFLTLMVSVFYFGNDFSMYHWMGTFLVFFGALVYADVIKMGKKEEKLHIQ